MIVLVPEIALAPQTVGRFRARFGDRVAILHSSLTEAERRDERERIASGAAPIVIGARSAVFAPLPRVGLICVDEEHDAAYKQESDPRYDARTVAAKRASLEGAVAIYGSATPRPESWQRARAARARRADRAPICRRCGSIDLRGEAGYPLSAPLLAELGKLAEDGGRRSSCSTAAGLAPALHCRACGETRRCPNCDVALVLHRDEALHCHHCAFVEPRRPRPVPPAARSSSRESAPGTQRLERELEAHVPELERFRLDADAIEKRGGAHGDAAALRRRRPRGARRDADRRQGAPLRGRVARGRDRRRHGLGVPDFRAEERTFQLVTQLAGCSGRDAPGRVLVQSVPARVAGGRTRCCATTSRASSRASSRGGRSSATRRFGTSCASSSRARTATT